MSNFTLRIEAESKIIISDKEFRGTDRYKFEYDKSRTKISNLINLRQFLCETLDEMITNSNEKDMEFYSLFMTTNGIYF